MMKRRQRRAPARFQFDAVPGWPTFEIPRVSLFTISVPGRILFPMSETLTVNEIYLSIQGEITVGELFTFILYSSYVGASSGGIAEL